MHRMLLLLWGGGRNPRSCGANSGIPSILQDTACKKRDWDHVGIRGPAHVNRELRPDSRRGSRCSCDHTPGSNNARCKPLHKNGHLISVTWVTCDVLIDRSRPAEFGLRDAPPGLVAPDLTRQRVRTASNESRQHRCIHGTNSVQLRGDVVFVKNEAEKNGSK